MASDDDDRGRERVLGIRRSTLDAALVAVGLWLAVEAADASDWLVVGVAVLLVLGGLVRLVRTR